MIFNSLDFAFFLPIVFILYWVISKRELKLQNFLIVAASYFFYGWWDWRFLALILFSTIVDYIVGLQLHKSEVKWKRRALLWTSILVNLGFLGFFKYYNFFVDNLVEAYTFFGRELSPATLNVVLPIGISFYTFQTLSYSIDIYRRKLEPSKDFIAFAAFVSFFPQLVAGPIERATNLLPQFYKRRKFDYLNAIDGVRQILWGMFKKVVIADNCAEYANIIFNNSEDYSGSTLAMGAVFFAFQIYGDFSGYSDIAIGTSRLFGFNLRQNFAFPYFARDMAEFWRRWHISLSSWFRDYLYIPLGGSRVNTFRRIMNTIIIFIVSGFWHGANWTFVIWGALNAFYFIPLLLSGRTRHNIEIVAYDRRLPTLRELFQIGLTFSLTTVAWVFFRAENAAAGGQYLMDMFSPSLFTVPEIRPMLLFVLVLSFICVEWTGRRSLFAIENIGLKWRLTFRLMFYYGIVFAILLLGGQAQEFIYFQF